MENLRFPKDFITQFESSYLPLAIFKVNLRQIELLYVTEGFVSSLSSGKEEAMEIFKNDPFVYVHPADRQMAVKTLENFLAGKGSFDEAIRCKYGSHTTYHPVRIIGKLNSYKGFRYAYFYFIDLHPYLGKSDSAKKASLELDNCTLTIKQDIFDPLTGLPTMGHFVDMSGIGVRSIFARGKGCAFLCFDFSGLKNYNLKFGNSEGDALIKGFAKILSSHFSPFCLGRFGADHFYGFTQMEGIEGELKIVFGEVKTLNKGNSLPVRVGVYPLKEDKPFDVLNCCDKAKFACDLDRTTYASHFSYFAPEMERSIAIRDYALSHVDEALEKGWIKAYYQPLIRAVTGNVCGEEALCRWEDPILGLIQPNDFIPYLEEARLLYKVDAYMVSLVVEDFKKKERAGLPLVPVSINLSRYDFEQGDIINEIKAALSKGGYSPSLINVEITEAVAGRDQQFTKTQIKRLHEAGFKVWMDDFGAGYSSLNVLSDFDFDLVKFDMKFLKDFSENSKSASLLSAIIEMVQSLGADTLCEGVETREQLIFLLNHGCDKIQGYYYRKPEPINRVLYGVSRIRREKGDEALYYETVGEYCLERPLGMPAPTGAKTGILEYQNGAFHFLRGSDGYREFLERTGAVNFSSFTKTRLPFLNAPSSSFVALVEKAIASGNPEIAPFMEDGFPFYQVIVKEIARKEGPNPSYALFVDLEPSSSSIIFGSGVVPEFEGRVLFDEAGSPEDVLFLRSNALHEAFCGIASSDFVGRKISEVYGKDYDRRWLELAYQCVKQRSDVRGERFSVEVMHDVIYRFTPKQGARDEFVCRFFEIDAEEFLDLKAKDSAGADTLLYKISSILAKDAGLSSVSDALGIAREGLKAKGIGYYSISYGGASLKSVRSMEANDFPKSLGKEAVSFFFSAIKKQGSYESSASEILAFFPRSSRVMVVPVIENRQTLGFLVCVDYPLDKKENALFILKEVSTLVAPRIYGFSNASKKTEKLKASSKPRKGLKKAMFPSAAEKGCLDAYNIGLLCFGSPFFMLLIFVLSFLSTHLSKENTGIALYYFPYYAIPRYVILGLYAVYSLVATAFGFYYRKRNKVISRKAVQSVLMIYAGLTCLLGAIISWQDYQTGLFDYIYVLCLLYVFACFRFIPWKSFLFLGVSFLFLCLFVHFVPCLPSLPLDSFSLRMSGDALYWGIGIGTAVVSSFLIIVMFYLFIRMLRLSTIDPLTQTRNRFALDMDKTSHYGRVCILMIIDIDDFKHWNDTYGHEKGDSLLRGFALSLMNWFGEDAVYRYGGDEFLVLADCDRLAFQKKVAGFKKELAELAKIKEGINFTAGFKEVCFSDDASFLNCVSDCDKLLYEGKKSGKSVIVER